MLYLYTYYICYPSTGLWRRKPEGARGEGSREPARLSHDIPISDQETDSRFTGAFTASHGESIIKSQPDVVKRPPKPRRLKLRHAQWFGREKPYCFRETSNFMAMVRSTNLRLGGGGGKEKAV